MGSFLYDGRLLGMLLGGLGGSLCTFFGIWTSPWATFSGLGGSLGERWDRFWILGGFWGSPEHPERPLGLARENKHGAQEGDRNDPNEGARGREWPRQMIWDHNDTFARFLEASGDPRSLPSALLGSQRCLRGFPGRLRVVPFYGTLMKTVFLRNR